MLQSKLMNLREAERETEKVLKEKVYALVLKLEEVAIIYGLNLYTDDFKALGILIGSKGLGDAPDPTPPGGGYNPPYESQPKLTIAKNSGDRLHSPYTIRLTDVFAICEIALTTGAWIPWKIFDHPTQSIDWVMGIARKKVIKHLERADHRFQNAERFLLEGRLNTCRECGSVMELVGGELSAAKTPDDQRFFRCHHCLFELPFYPGWFAKLSAKTISVPSRKR